MSADSSEYQPPGLRARLRSLVTLVGLTVLLGVVAAAIVGAVVVATVTLLDHALA